METKRSKGITVLAWLMIILNIFILLQSLDFKYPFELFKSFHKNLIIIVVLYSILSAALGIIAGIGLLKLKDIMRRIGIAINSLDLLFGVPLFFLSLNDIKQYFYSSVVSELARKPTSLSIETLTNICFYAGNSVALIIFGLNILFIYFFTRPKVKEQFKK